ncbi:MAG: MBL fold metallo-hydrolase [Gemmatimonadota bacterium]
MSIERTPDVKGFTGGGFGENGYVVSCPATHKGILVDPGAGVEQMLAAVKAGEIEIDAIVLTHAHIDHVDGVAAAKRETGAPVHLHPDDESLYRQAAAQAQWFGMEIEPPPPVDEYLREGEEVRFGECTLKVLHTPGHAPGHVILVGGGVAIVGDCVFSGSIGRTDLPGGDFQTLMASIRKHILTLPDETVLYSGHGPQTTVGHERVANPFLAPQLGGSSFA